MRRALNTCRSEAWTAGIKKVPSQRPSCERILDVRNHARPPEKAISFEIAKYSDLINDLRTQSTGKDVPRRAVSAYREIEIGELPLD